LLDQGLAVLKAGELLAREGVVVPQRTLPGVLKRR
jgi:hypothetical protein